MTIFKKKIITPTTVDVPINFPETFKLKLPGDADLVAEKIKSGETLFGVAGTFAGTTVGTEEIQMKLGEAVAVNDPVYFTATLEGATTLSDPETLPTGTIREMSFDPTGVYLAIPHSTSPYLTIYKRSGDTFTKLANPATLPTGTGYGCGWSPDSTYLAVTFTASPYVMIYKRNGDVFTKLDNPTVLPSANAHVGKFDPSGTYLAVGCSGTTPLIIYKRSGDTFSTTGVTITSQPVSGDDADALDWSPCGTYLAGMSDGNTRQLWVWKRSGDTFTTLGAITGAPLNNLTANYSSCAFSPNGLYLAIGCTYDDSLPCDIFMIFKRSGDTFTKLSISSVLTSLGTPVIFWGVERVVWSPDSKYLILCLENATTELFSIRVITHSGDTFSQDRVLISNLTNGINTIFSPDGKTLITGDGYFDARKLDYLAYKSANTLAGITDRLGCGYAKQAGSAGETKTVVKLLEY